MFNLGAYKRNIKLQTKTKKNLYPKPTTKGVNVQKERTG
jgi:hypothetical protein